MRPAVAAVAAATVLTSPCLLELQAALVLAREQQLGHPQEQEWGQGRRQAHPQRAATAPR